MRGPGVPADLRCGALLYLLDLYPTLLQLAGIARARQTSAGHSLVNALLSQATYKHRKQIFSAYQGVFGRPAGSALSAQHQGPKSTS